MTGAQVNPVNARDRGGRGGEGGGAEYSCMVHSVPATCVIHPTHPTHYERDMNTAGLVAAT